MHDLLRAVWDEPRPARPPRRVWRDWALVGGLLPVALLEGFLRPDLPDRVVSTVIVVALLPTLLWRRSRPLAVLAGSLAAGWLALLATGANTPQSYASAYFLILPYALYRWGSGREKVLGSALVVTKVVGWGLLGFLGLTDVVGGIVVLSAAAALGTAARYRARARQRELDQVKLLERARLARDLHDTVAHHVSAMAIRAQAGLAVAPSDPQAATDALRVIEAEASRALAEMRAMVRLLRHDSPAPAELAPSPRIGDLERLADGHRGGPAVDVTIEGDVADLPPSVDTAIYRLAQESVTNARRHARHATRIEVNVAADDTTVRLRVRDDGDTGPTPPRRPGGFGLVGMAERAGLLGGTCAAGPDPDGGWTVSAVLPRKVLT